jgi:spoIIIJ-associated protein
MKQIEIKAKTINEAIDDACAQLGVTQDQLDIEILSQGGMFGKAKILATVKPSAEKPAPFSFEKTRSDKSETETFSFKETRSGEDCSSLNRQKPAQKFTSSADASVDANDKSSVSRPAPAPHTPVGTPCAPTTLKTQKTTAFVTELLKIIEPTATINTTAAENNFNINIDGENIGRLIGKNGVTMNALQTIVSAIARNHDTAPEDGPRTRVFVNIGDYKDKRVDSVQALALKKADYVKRTGRFVKLDPMNARERAIIHTHLQNIEGIKTYSTGKEPFRCLCIAPADGTDTNN